MPLTLSPRLICTVGRNLTLPLLLAAMLPAVGSAQWRLDGWFGDAWNAKTPLTIRQEGEQDIRVTPDWSTRPFTPTWYYGARIAHMTGASGWGVEFVHHKLYLDNPPEPEVTRFWITNGVNIIMAQRILPLGKQEVSIGAGPTWGVPRSTVRGETYSFTRGKEGGRYDFAGWSGQVGVTRRLKVAPHVYGVLGLKGTITTIDLPIARGRAETTNLALHVNYGISLQTKP